MAKEFKLSPSQQARIKKLNKSISTKKSRIKKEFGIELQIKTKPIKEFKSKKEYNEFIKNAENFTNRANFRYVKNKNNVVVRREEYEALKKDVETINKRNRRKVNKIKRKTFTSRGKKTAMRVADRAMMLDTRYSRLIDLDFKKRFEGFRSAQEFEDYAQRADYRANPEYENEMQQKLLDNYIAGGYNVFGDEWQPIAEKLKSIGAEGFEMMFYTEDVLDFEFYYGVTEEELKLKSIKEALGI